MNFVKANMSFYHDKVGSRAHNEVFQVESSELAANLEKMGYVTKATAEEAGQNPQLQEQVGQRQALTNEAVSMSHHVQNLEANAHTQNVSQMRQQMRTEQQPQGQTGYENNTASKNANAKKATDK